MQHCSVYFQRGEMNPHQPSAGTSGTLFGGDLSPSALSRGGPMIVETSADGRDDVWLVRPIARYCVKFKDVRMDRLPGGQSHKFFINFCTCDELPPPSEDLEEDQVAAILDSSQPDKYRIPISVGAIEWVADNRGEKSAKVEVLMNTSFYDRRVAKSAFFSHLLLVVACDAIEARYGNPRLEAGKAVRLRNRRAIGDVSNQRIRARPAAGLVQDVSEDSRAVDANAMEVEEDAPVVDGATTSSTTPPSNYRILVRDRGRMLEIRVRLPPAILHGENGATPFDIERLSLEMNDDRVVVTWDNSTPLLDIFVPICMDFENADCELDVGGEHQLVITVPIVVL